MQVLQGMRSLDVPTGSTFSAKPLKLPLFLLSGGHSTEILRRLSKDGRLWAFDLDPNAVAVGQKLEAMDSRFKILHRPFADVQVA